MCLPNLEWERNQVSKWLEILVVLFGPLPPVLWSPFTLIAYFLYKTKFGTIVAAVNQVAGEMVFTLVRAARGGFDGEEAEEQEYAEEEIEAAVPANASARTVI